MSFKISGFDDFEHSLRDFEHRARALDGETKVPLGELFHTAFMKRNTDFSTISAFFDATGFKIESQADFESISEQELDQFVKTNSRFGSWKEMFQEAMQEWA